MIKAMVILRWLGIGAAMFGGMKLGMNLGDTTPEMTPERWQQCDRGYLIFILGAVITMIAAIVETRLRKRLTR